VCVRARARARAHTSHNPCVRVETLLAGWPLEARITSSNAHPPMHKQHPLPPTPHTPHRSAHTPGWSSSRRRTGGPAWAPHTAGAAGARRPRPGPCSGAQTHGRSPGSTPHPLAPARWASGSIRAVSSRSGGAVKQPLLGPRQARVGAALGVWTSWEAGGLLLRRRCMRRAHAQARDGRGVGVTAYGAVWHRGSVRLDRPAIQRAPPFR